jgi:hypothetical protein
MNFTESNTVEQMILNTAIKLGGKKPPIVHEDAPISRGE